MSEIKIRRATADDAGAIAEVHVQSWRSSYRGIIAESHLAGLSVVKRTAIWSRQICGDAVNVWVASDSSDRIVGFCSAGANRDEPRDFDGEVYAIYLVDEAKRRGIGRALFECATRDLVQRGWSSWVVWVLADNLAARQFYERLGGREVGDKPVTIGEQEFIEVAYGWEKTSALIRR